MPKPVILQTGTAKTGSHTHQCSKNNHSFTCQYTTKCTLEMFPSAQKIIDDMCPKCHNDNYGSYAS